ncbi:hypothetical protein llap_5866 [Limosa lapponica baueri]|uniref:Uncharacterized protein n=1 Tax=Limosa lapponica baueri TaxID=1758121 RepID=A0A2I0UCX2_LIMLA|nr:hypothetical protein llap_5866 [Limosa lapponica baueri]
MYGAPNVITSNCPLKAIANTRSVSNLKCPSCNLMFFSLIMPSATIKNSLALSSLYLLSDGPSTYAGFQTTLLLFRKTLE